jgi:hypothetical protein
MGRIENDASNNSSVSLNFFTEILTSNNQQLKKKSAARALNTVLASAHTQMT